MPRSQQDKPFRTPKQAVWQAYEKVKRNQGAPGVDGQSLAEFEAGLQGNLYKIWNRMSSETSFPPPVRAVEIPKAPGAGVRQAAIKAKSAGIRAMRIHRRTTWPLNELARWLNLIVGGWMNGRFYRSAMAPLLRRVNTYMKRWARKHKRLRSHKMFQRRWTGLRKREPVLLAQWKWVTAY